MDDQARLCIWTGPQHVLIYDVTLARTVVAGAGNTERQNPVLTSFCRPAPFGFAGLPGRK